MSGDIELKNFEVKTPEENYKIQEYYEITETLTRPPSRQEPNLPNNYAFFTEQNYRKSKKKKTKKKETSQNLMELINCELAATDCPVTENLIKSRQGQEAEHQGYMQLQLSSTLSMVLQKIPWRPFRRWRPSSSTALNPQFPAQLEDALQTSPIIPTYYSPPISYNTVLANGAINTQKPTKFLNIQIKELHFKHHHFFSLEMLLAERLQEIFSFYGTLGRVIENIGRDITVNRDTKDNLKKELEKVCSKKEDVRFDPTIRKYTKQMLVLKGKYLEAMKKKREVMNACVTLWSDIETVRGKNNMQQTNLTLVVTKETKGKDEFDQEWAEAFQTECEDLLEQVEYDFVTEYLKYKEEKHDLRGDHKKIHKPKLHIDEDGIKKKAEEMVNEIVKRDSIDIKIKVDKKHVLNKELFAETTCYFKVFVDSTLVCESDTSTACGFHFQFMESLSIEILDSNDHVDVVLFEGHLKIASCALSLSGIKKTSKKVGYNEIKMESDLEMLPNTRFIGSGHTIKEIASANKIRLKSSNMFKGHIITTCLINIKVGWEEEIGKSDESIVKYKKIDSQISRFLSGIEKPNIDSLKTLLQTVYDKNVEEDELVLKTLKTLTKSNMGRDDFEFAVDENDPQFSRIKLLYLRSKGEMVNVENKVIPLFPSQITTDQLNVLQKYKNHELDVSNMSSDKYSDMEPIEVQRFIGTKYVESLNKKILQFLNENLLKKSHRDVVIENISLRSLFTRSQNNRYNGQNGARYHTNGGNQDLEVNVSVLRAFNLPDRNSMLGDDNAERDETIAGYKVRSLRPFVRVYHKGEAVQTGTALGCHPTWSHTLRVTAKSDPTSLHINVFDEHKTQLHDTAEYYEGTLHFKCCAKWLGEVVVPLYGVRALGMLRGTFKLNVPPILLGYESAEKSQEEQSLVPQINQLLRKESSFIALQITTNKPPITNHNLPLPNDNEDYIIKHLNNFITEFSNNFSSRVFSLHFIDSAGKNKCVTQFLQPVPLPEQEVFPKNPKRSDSAFSKSSILSKSSSSKSLDGKKDVERGSEERDSIYSAYDRNWRVESDLEKILNSIMRYVSLIPTYEVKETHYVTLMGVELLRILYGSPLDHTILLASYFMYLGIKTYIVMGIGLPRGPSSYVLTKYDLGAKKIVLQNDTATIRSNFLTRSEAYVWHLYDAVKGERFELRDVSCPLKTVDYIFDCENIWVNVQNAQESESVCFDLNRTSQWQKVFDKNIFLMRQPTITDNNLYKTPSDVETLRVSLENRIKAKIQKWRSHSKTIWNRYCSSVLREILPLYEYWSFHPTQPKPNVGQKMRQLMVTYKVYGFPLNLPFTSLKSIISSVKSTSVHVNDDPNVEFGLAVEVYGYPNNVLSVWVFIASVLRI